MGEYANKKETYNLMVSVSLTLSYISILFGGFSKHILIYIMDFRKQPFIELFYIRRTDIYISIMLSCTKWKVKVQYYYLIGTNTVTVFLIVFYR